MIAQVVLLCMLSGVALYAASQRGRAPVVSLSMLAVALGGAVFVLFPDAANAIAHAVGVGRGADLVLYVFIIIVLGVALNLHLRLRASQEMLTKLIREIAIADARKSKEH